MHNHNYTPWVVSVSICLCSAMQICFMSVADFMKGSILQLNVNKIPVLNRHKGHSSSNTSYLCSSKYNYLTLLVKKRVLQTKFNFG